MHRPIWLLAVFVALSLGLSACNSSSSSGTPFAVPSPSNISGDYTGTFTDAQGGSATATGTLAQHATSAGGSFTLTETTQAVALQMSLSLDLTNAVAGTFVSNAGGTTCTFSTTGTYAPSTATLSGSYKAVAGCSGDTGTYTLTQQCTYTVTSGRRRPDGGPALC